MPNEPLVPVHTSLDPDNRITLPKHVSDRILWMTGTNVQPWLLLLAPGRYRLLSDEQVQNDPQLEPVRLLILEGKPAVVSEPTYSKDLNDEAIVARLVPIAVAQHKQSQSWRISFPRELLKAFAPPDCGDPKAFSILLSLEGYWEIWYTDVLRKAVYSPLS
ncbi:MAG TPA: hypothetical protein VF311_14270 [Terriglobales bacterium]|jgi:hypothetical protein